MARKRRTAIVEVSEPEVAVEEEAPEEEFSEREVGTVVDEVALPYEVRKDGSIAYFTQEQASLLREVGS